MLSSRRIAQLGVGASVLMLAVSLTVLARSGNGAWKPRLLEVGARVPDFTLSDVDGQAFAGSSLRGKAAVLFFGSTRGAQSTLYNPRITRLAEQYAGDQRVQFVAINRPAPGYGPEDPREVRVQARALGRDFPTLIDEDNRVAALFGAVDGPTFYVLDADGEIRYRGPFDDNAQESQVTQHYCSQALQAVLADAQHQQHAVTVASSQPPANNSRRP